MNPSRKAIMTTQHIDKRLHIDTDFVKAFLVNFIREELQKAGYQRAVLGLSGGLDSALSCLLTAQAVGPDNVLALWMPYRTSDPANYADAQKVATQSGVVFKTVDITPMVEPYFEQMPEMSLRRRGNVMARARMIVLYDHSEVWHGLVIGTSNKTEIWLGYGTLFGDMACAINPLGDLYKTQLRQLARAMGVPASILAKTPSADLWAGQTDEGEIGFRYEELDRALYLLVDEGYTMEQAIACGLSRELVECVANRIRWSAFKRQLPIVAKLPHAAKSQEKSKSHK